MDQDMLQSRYRPSHYSQRPLNETIGPWLQTNPPYLGLSEPTFQEAVYVTLFMGNLQNFRTNRLRELDAD